MVEAAGRVFGDPDKAILIKHLVSEKVQLGSVINHLGAIINKDCVMPQVAGKVKVNSPIQPYIIQLQELIWRHLQTFYIQHIRAHCGLIHLMLMMVMPIDEMKADQWWGILSVFPKLMQIRHSA